MQTSQDDTVMDFGPNLFGGDSNAVSGSVADDADSKAEASSGDMPSLQKLEDIPGQSPDRQAGTENVQSSNDEVPGGKTEQTAAQTSPGKLEVGPKALASAKAAVKILGSITGFDEQSDTQRRVVRELMSKHTQAMEFKLQGKKPQEGEDFDSIAKQLRRENNRLDTLLEGKEVLFSKARKAAEAAIVNMQSVIAEINRLEEEG